MARMGAASAPPSQAQRKLDAADALSHKTLFHSFMPRYLCVPAVQQWLMNRDPVLPRYSASLNSSMSYACMYFPPNVSSPAAASYPVPAPFLDIGDFMLCEHVFDGIAVGTLYNQREDHALGILRDKMLKTPKLSSHPRARKFAVDLTVSNLEIIEFAWMDDDSLIIACRRLDRPIAPGMQSEDLVLSGDLLFYDVVPQGTLQLGAPLLRMTLSEKPAICQFCGTRGIKTCACPSTFKTRAPTEYSVPVPLSHEPFPENKLRIVPQGSLAGVLSTWDGYTKRIFNVNTAGAFFVHWYRRAPNSDGMTLFMSPRHPIPYTFSCGNKEQTLCLASTYVKRMKLCERSYAADARLFSYLSKSSDINLLLENGPNTPRVDDIFELEEIDTDSFLVSDDSIIPTLNEQDMTTDALMLTGSALSTSDTASTNPSFDSDTAGFEESSQYILSPPGNLLMSQPTLSTCTTLSGDTSGASHDDLPSLANSESPDMKSNLRSDLRPPTGTSAKSSHVMDNVFEAWEQHASAQNTPSEKAPPPTRPPRLTLSTTSREVQKYMTVDASNTPTCKECGSRFPKRGNLARHIQTVHLKLKPFQCEHCHASFGYKNHLKRHQIIHQRGNEFKCRICSRECKSQAQLTRHIQQAHQQQESPGNGNGNVATSEEGDRSRVSCDKCGVSFSQKSNLSRHKLIHEGLRFVCPVCPNKTSFGQRYDLHRHLLRKHPGIPDTSFASITPERVGSA